MSRPNLQQCGGVRAIANGQQPQQQLPIPNGDDNGLSWTRRPHQQPERERVEREQPQHAGVRIEDEGKDAATAAEAVSDSENSVNSNDTNGVTAWHEGRANVNTNKDKTCVVVERGSWSILDRG